MKWIDKINKKCKKSVHFNIASEWFVIGCIETLGWIIGAMGFFSILDIYLPKIEISNAATWMIGIMMIFMGLLITKFNDLLRTMFYSELKKHEIIKPLVKGQ